MNDSRLPSASETLLRDRFQRLREAGLKDLKFWFVGAASEETSVDDLCDEAMSILDACDQKRFVDIDEKLR